MDKNDSFFCLFHSRTTRAHFYEALYMWSLHLPIENLSSSFLNVRSTPMCHLFALLCTVLMFSQASVGTSYLVNTFAVTIVGSIESTGYNLLHVSERRLSIPSHAPFFVHQIFDERGTSVSPLFWRHDQFFNLVRCHDLWESCIRDLILMLPFSQFCEALFHGNAQLL
jgi:hypothetical protein